MTTEYQRPALGVGEETCGAHMTPNQLRHYAAGHAAGMEVKEFERHLLVCPECRRQLVRAGVDQVSASRSRWMRRTAFAGTAAVLVIVSASLLLRSPDEPGSSLRTDRSPERLEAIAPIGDAAGARDGITFVWRSAGVDAYYQLTVTDAVGEVAWTTETGDTTVMLPSEVVLAPGEVHFWFADALLEGAASTTTGIQEFRIR